MKVLGQLLAIEAIELIESWFTLSRNEWLTHMILFKLTISFNEV